MYILIGNKLHQYLKKIDRKQFKSTESFQKLEEFDKILTVWCYDYALYRQKTRKNEEANKESNWDISLLNIDPNNFS